MQTGERKATKLSDDRGSWACGITYCIGSAISDTGNQGSGGTLVQRRDGESLVMLGDVGMGAGEFPAYDRFASYLAPLSEKSSRQGLMLQDLKTRKVADLGIHTSQNEAFSYSSVPDPSNRLYVAERKNAYVLIDLASI